MSICGDTGGSTSRPVSEELIAQWMAENQCPGPRVHKEGRCVDCGQCRRCTPPPWCSASNHRWPRRSRQSLTHNTATPRTKRLRKSKSAANKSLSQQSSGNSPPEIAIRRAEEDDEHHQHSSSITPEAVFAMLGIKTDKKQAVSTGTMSDRSVEEWSLLADLCIDKILDVFFIGDKTRVRQAVIQRQARKAIITAPAIQTEENAKIAKCVLSTALHGSPEVMLICKSVLATALKFKSLCARLREADQLTRAQDTADHSSNGLAATPRQSQAQRDHGDQHELILLKTPCRHSFAHLRAVYNTVIAKGLSPPAPRRPTLVSY